MTALPVSGTVRPLAVEPNGYASSLFSAFRKVAAKLNEVESKRSVTAQAKIAARANTMLREHGSMGVSL